MQCKDYECRAVAGKTGAENLTSNDEEKKDFQGKKKLQIRSYLLFYLKEQTVSRKQIIERRNRTKSLFGLKRQELQITK